MVYSEIDKLPELIHGRRIIMYYIKDDINIRLSNSVEFVLDMLEKKNDDLIIFKFNKNSPYFTQFKEIYRPELKGEVSLFVVNSDGIPLICEEISNKDNICQAIGSICSCCKLKSVSNSEMSKLYEKQSKEPSTESFIQDINGPRFRFQPLSVEENSSSQSGLSTSSSKSETVEHSDDCLRPSMTKLQICLPNGIRDQQAFEVDSHLQEVHDFIQTKHNLRDFYLKTYKHPNFSPEDYEKSLKVLDLTPNGVIIVVSKNVSSLNNTGKLSSMLTNTLSIFFGPVSSLFLYVRGFLYGLWVHFFSNGNGRPGQAGNQPDASNTISKKRPTTKRYSSNTGNIHTLRRTDDSDDENNRYNGNSTQQK